jgi:hypothetical protein
VGGGGDRIGDDVHPVPVGGDPPAEALVQLRPLAPARDQDQRAARRDAVRLAPACDLSALGDQAHTRLR